jgi:hypothetical protein
LVLARIIASRDLSTLTAWGVAHKVFGEDFAAVRIDFDEGDCSESCPLGGKGKPSNSREKVDMGWFHLADGDN